MAPKSTEESVERLRKRMEAGDPIIATYNVGCFYREGLYGFSNDMDKALEHWHRAAELGHAAAYCSIGAAYELGRGVEVDQKKATQYYELAAMDGDEKARHNLGNNEAKAGNIDRALKHYIIAAGCGDSQSVKMIKTFYANGHATKEHYTKALQSYQTYLDEIKSSQRDEAAQFDIERYRYY